MYMKKYAKPGAGIADIDVSNCILAQTSILDARHCWWWRYIMSFVRSSAIILSLLARVDTLLLILRFLKWIYESYGKTCWALNPEFYFVMQKQKSILILEENVLPLIFQIKKNKCNEWSWKFKIVEVINSLHNILKNVEKIIQIIEIIYM